MGRGVFCTTHHRGCDEEFTKRTPRLHLPQNCPNGQLEVRIKICQRSKRDDNVIRPLDEGR
jgi:hypothetical protein